MSFRENRPQPDEHAPYFSKYLALVPDGDIIATLDRQMSETVSLITSLSEEQGQYRYAPEKWSVKEVIGHITDTERVFGYRTLCFARGETNELPGFDENVFAAHARFEQYTQQELAHDYQAVRSASLSLLAGLDETAWLRPGIASKNQVSVRSLIWLMAGHQQHHLDILQTRYLNQQ